MQPTLDAWLQGAASVASVRGGVAVDASASSAEAYAARRSGGGGDLESGEARVWQKHLADRGIGSMGNALIFLRARSDNPSAEVGAAVRTFAAPKAWSATDQASHAAVCAASDWACASP